MNDMSRRGLLGVTAMGGAMLAASASAGTPILGNPDRPGEGRTNITNPLAGTEPGPQNRALADNFPSFNNPPSTDVGGLDLFWASFNNAHKRIQDGGWAREVTVDDFPASDAVSGVNMRLAPGGVRELHWHQQAEWAVMVDGQCRVTVLDSEGRPQIRDVKSGDLWYFPPGLPHSLQGLGASGAEFVLVFDNGKAGEFNTLLLTEWMAHTPPEVLAENFNLPVSAFQNIPLDQKWIYQGKVPGPLADVQKATRSPLGEPTMEFVYEMGKLKPLKSNKSGSIRIADSTNFGASKNIAAALVTVAPGGMREMHWHPNADEWQYYIKGSARMTVFNAGPRAQTADFRPGDIGVVKKGLGHYVQNTGDTELVFMEIFKTDRYQEVTLAQWLAGSPPEMLAETLGLDAETIKTFSHIAPGILPL